MDGSDEAGERIKRLAPRDRLMRLLGMRCLDGGPGRAAVSLAIGEDHLNFNGTCHGGAIFALADSAFGLASNSHGVIAAAIDAHVTYQVAVKPGDTLTATAIEVSRSRKLGVYHVDVTRQDGTLVSTFTGTVYVTERPNEGDQ
jgi:phenylacetic acid degradation protein PaaD